MAELTVTRRYDFPPEKVFDAWLDPAVARRFLFTTSKSEVVVCEIDARVGGRFNIVDRREGQEDIVHVGEYLEIARPRRLVFTFGVPQFDPTMTRVTIDIRREGAGCELVLTHDDVPPEWVEQDREGWTMILESLSRELA
ncbi:SRPBCC domain-containing protein [Phenylobacterium sp.]|uniref:SRPBCC family protein n=1 Tax=Phenylobacterium sp. TaxID=1871053 RepID=UPI002F92ABAC